MIERHVNQRSSLAELFKLVCSEKNLDPERYALRHPNTPDVALDMTSLLAEYGLTQLTLVPVGEHITVNTSVENPVECRENESRSQMKSTCEKKGIQAEKLVTCAYCAKQFTRKSELRVHERIHTGEKPFQCQYCAKQFPSISNLKVHEQTHTGEKPYQCGYCGKRFTQKVKCCRHELIHTGEKPHQCILCGKRFATIDYYRRHGLTHSGMKPFQCQFCEKRFSLKGNCRTHEKIHTGKH